MKSGFDVTTHMLVPKHSKLNDKEKNELFSAYSVSLKDLPKMLITDPAIQHLNPKEGDLIKIMRASPTAGRAVFYRRVTNV